MQTSLPPLPLNNGALWVSGTWLEDAMSCSRKAEYSKLWGRVLAEPSPALNFGTHLHSVMALHFRLEEFGLSPLEKQERVLRLIEKIFADSPQVEGDWRTANWLVEIYKRFQWKFPAEDFELLSYDEPQPCGHCGPEAQADCLWCMGTGKHKIMVEVPFAVPLFRYPLKGLDWKLRDQVEAACGKGYLDVILRGFIDLPVRWRDRPWVLDFKSTSMLGDAFWNDKAMSAQQRGYAWAWEKLTGEALGGYIVRTVRTKEPPISVLTGKTKRDGTAPKAIDDWWHESLTEQRFYLQPGALDEWHRNTVAVIEEFLWHYSRGHFPQRTTSCHAKWRCHYFEVCSTQPPEARAFMLASGLFKDKEKVMTK